MNHRVAPKPLQNGKDLIAKASFGTQFGVSIIVGVSALLVDMIDVFYCMILFLSMMGSSCGYWLWRQGYRQTSITLSTGGLIGAGILSHILLQTIGGPTGILLLASVITAGGLGGKKEAAIASGIVLGWLVVGYVLIPHEIVQIPEVLLLTFVGFSVPCWGAYVVAIDISNLEAMAKAESSLEDLQEAHQILRSQQDALEQVYQHQNKVIELGLLAMSDISIEDLLSQCFAGIRKDQFGVFVGQFNHQTCAINEYNSSHHKDVVLQPSFWPANGEQHLRGQADLDPHIGALLPKESMVFGYSVPIHSAQFDGSLVVVHCQTAPFSSHYINFLREIGQFLQIRYMREAALAERAKLAAHIQQEQRMESLVRMAGEVAHDFNNTLMVISGTADVFANHDRFPFELQKSLLRMQNATQISAELTNKLLTFCRGVNAPRIPIDPVQTISKVIPVLEFTVKERAELLFTAPSSKGRTIKASVGQLEQVLLNLMTNARDAIKSKGEIQLRLAYRSLKNEIWVEETAEQATHLLIEVSDNGVGMSANELERVIEPFYSTKASYRGGGLGLAIVHGVVSQIKGQLRIDSQQSQGTTVTIMLPFQQSDKVIAKLDDSNGGTSILLVDDEPDVRHAVAMQLDMLGYEVFHAGSIAEALPILQQEKLLLLITDVRLQGETGYDLVKKLRDENNHIPVLYITGFSGFQDDAHAGNEEVLLKPFDSAQLERKIQQVLAVKMNA